MHARIRGRRHVERRAAWLQLHPLCDHCSSASPPRVRIATQVDHVVPLFKGGADDETNFQSLCVDCHASKTAEDMGQGPSSRCDASGWPVDPRHHWNRTR